MASSLPFTRSEFLDLFARYNAATWPAELVAYGLAIVTLSALVRPEAWVQRLAGLSLAAMWLWTGAVYHWRYFASINGAAWLFGALFVAQGLCILALSAGGRLRFHAARDRWAGLGAAFILYAAMLYPLAGIAAAEGSQRYPAFGIAPCPLTLFTVGILILMRARAWLWFAPVIWSFVGGSGAFLLDVPQDLPLLLVAPVFVLHFRAHLRRAPTASRETRRA